MSRLRRETGSGIKGAFSAAAPERPATPHHRRPAPASFALVGRSRVRGFTSMEATYGDN